MALGPPSSTLDPAPKEGEARSKHKKELPLAKMMSGRIVQGSQTPLNDHPSQKSPLLMALGPPYSTLDPAPTVGEARSGDKKELHLAKMVSGRMDRGSQ